MGEIIELRIVRKEENRWDLYQSDKQLLIETYKMTETISFSGLIKQLLKDEFKHVFRLEENSIENPNEYETKLMSLIKEILGEYEKSLKEYETFVESKKTAAN